MKIDKREFLQRFLNGEVSREETTSLRYQNMTDEELCRQIIVFDGRPGLPEGAQSEINKCKTWINENC